ncbi:MAG: hypothetical protein Q8M03_07015, partial [Legionella sp.]|nr:hypothetical protein [Legionella sp.]
MKLPFRFCLFFLCCGVIRVRLPLRLLPALALTASLIHFFAEGYRRQTIPLYVPAPLLASSSLTKNNSAPDWKPGASC